MQEQELAIPILEHFELNQAFKKYFLLLEPPRRLDIAWRAPKVVVSSGKVCEGIDLCLRKERDQGSEVRQGG